jgi:hypothetical protein
VDVRVYPECPHGFTSFPTAMASAAFDDIRSWLAERLLEAQVPAGHPQMLDDRRAPAGAQRIGVGLAGARLK